MQMVNTWFPGIAPYGFEMVDASKTARSTPGDRHLSNIYTGSNHAVFWQTPRDL